MKWYFIIPLNVKLDDYNWKLKETHNTGEEVSKIDDDKFSEIKSILFEHDNDLLDTEW